MAEAGRARPALVTQLTSTPLCIRPHAAQSRLVTRCAIVVILSGERGEDHNRIGVPRLHAVREELHLLLGCEPVRSDLHARTHIERW